MIIVYTTFSTMKTADKVCRQLVHARLVGCYVFWPVHAVYWWKKKITATKEVAVFLKTTRHNIAKVRYRLEKLHPDEVPCIASFRVTQHNAAYAAWLAKACL